MGVARPQGLGWPVLAISFSAFGSSFNLFSYIATVLKQNTLWK